MGLFSFVEFRGSVLKLNEASSKKTQSGKTSLKMNEIS